MAKTTSSTGAAWTFFVVVVVVTAILSCCCTTTHGFVVVVGPTNHHHSLSSSSNGGHRFNGGRSTLTTVFSNVVSEALLKELEDDAANDPKPRNNNRRTRLTRPERKALERARKEQQQQQQASQSQQQQASSQNNRRRGHRRHNYAARSDQLIGRKPGEGRYELHSQVTPELTPNSTPDEIMRAIKRAQNLHDRHDLKAITRFLLEQTDDSFAYGFKGSLLARLAVAALHLNYHSTATQAIRHRRQNFRSSMLPLESAALVRNLLRTGNTTTAWQLWDDELALPLEGTDWTTPEHQDRLKHRALACASIASRHLFRGEPRQAVYALDTLAAMGPLLQRAGLQGEDLPLPWARMMQGAAQCQAALRNGQKNKNKNHKKAESKTTAVVDEEQDGTKNARMADHLPCNLVYSVLNAMTTVPSENDDYTFELFSNALVRRVVFVTGAVSMEGCPPADRGEAAFIGRSNVGKSSLVNMITNRKSLAYTSKRPGKTQQFNFFAVNDKVGREKEIKYSDVVAGKKDADSFYMVDLPGFGYAKVPEKQRRAWYRFMSDYVSQRETLRVVFHLIDSRHGPTAEDELIMRQMRDVLCSSSSSQSSSRVKYVVVLTKADKNVKGVTRNFSGKLSTDILNKVHRAIDDNFSSNNNYNYKVPVVLTSAETKLGRDEMWKYLCRAAAAAA